MEPMFTQNLIKVYFERPRLLLAWSPGTECVRVSALLTFMRRLQHRLLAALPCLDWAHPRDILM